MAQSLIKVYIHIIFSTQNRAEILPKDNLHDVHSYIGGIMKNHGCMPIAIGGTRNHVHILCELGATISPSELVKHIKGSSSKWIKANIATPEGFAWQNGYAVFSVSESTAEAVVRYIANQEEHHRKRDFKGELLEFLRLYKVEYDEKYLWT